MSNIQWDSAQTEILQFPTAKTGSLVVEAVAGSGKTTVCKGLLERIPANKSAVYLAFNRDIVEDIQADLADQSNQFDIRCRLTVSTFHSLMTKAIFASIPGRRTKINDGGKSFLVFDQMAKGVDGLPKLDVPHNMRLAVKILAGVVRFNGYLYVDPTGIGGPRKFTKKEWRAMVDRYDVDNCLPDKDESTYDMLLSSTVLAVQYWERMAVQVIDFDDMLWWPLVNTAIRNSLPKFDWVFVDEAQDMNFCRRTLVKYLLRPGGRVVFVGDKNQAIYGFAGADYDSMDLAKAEYHCQPLPLHTSRRCPKAVVAVARTWVDHITAWEGAPEGAVQGPGHFELESLGLNPDTDMVICRVNKPLIGLFFRLMEMGIPSLVLGADIAKKLVQLIGKVRSSAEYTGPKKGSKSDTAGQFVPQLRRYRASEVESLMEAGRKTNAGVLDDLCGGLLIILAKAAKTDPMYSVERSIEAMFVGQDGKPLPQDGRLVLSSIHKSKGRESHRIIWLGENLYQPSKYATTPEDIQQERNLCYVAATRAKHTLVRLSMVRGQFDEDPAD